MLAFLSSRRVFELVDALGENELSKILVGEAHPERNFTKIKFIQESETTNNDMGVQDINKYLALQISSKHSKTKGRDIVLCVDDPEVQTLLETKLEYVLKSKYETKQNIPNDDYEIKCLESMVKTLSYCDKLDSSSFSGEILTALMTLEKLLITYRDNQDHLFSHKSFEYIINNLLELTSCADLDEIMTALKLKYFTLIPRLIEFDIIGNEINYSTIMEQEWLLYNMLELIKSKTNKKFLENNSNKIKLNMVKNHHSKRRITHSFVYDIMNQMENCEDKKQIFYLFSKYNELYEFNSIYTKNFDISLLKTFYKIRSGYDTNIYHKRAIVIPVFNTKKDFYYTYTCISGDIELIEKYALGEFKKTNGKYKLKAIYNRFNKPETLEKDKYEYYYITNIDIDKSTNKETDKLH